MIMRGKAQSSVEFMAVIAAIIFIAAIAQVLIFSKYNEAWQLRAYLDSQDVCNSVSNELSLAGYSEGRSSYFTLPQDIAGGNYTLTVWNGIVTADYQGHACVGTYIVRSLKYGNSTPPFNMTGGRYRINTTAGLVTLEKMA